MVTDDLIVTINQYMSKHQNPKIALIPENLPQGILDIFIEDAQNLKDHTIQMSGRYLSTAVVLLLSTIRGSSKLDIKESELKEKVSLYTQAVYLESLERKGLIKNLQPSRDISNILEAVELTYELTELGKQAALENASVAVGYDSELDKIH